MNFIFVPEVAGETFFFVHFSCQFLAWGVYLQRISDKEEASWTRL